MKCDKWALAAKIMTLSTVPYLWAEGGSFDSMASHLSDQIHLIQYFVSAGIALATIAIFLHALGLLKAHRLNPLYVPLNRVLFVFFMGVFCTALFFYSPMASWPEVQPIPTVKNLQPRKEIKKTEKIHWSHNVKKKDNLNIHF